MRAGKATSGKGASPEDGPGGGVTAWTAGVTDQTGEKAPVGYSLSPSGHRITVRALARPEPDVRMLAKIFWQMAVDDMKRADEDDRAA
ncbi:hypothetical protein QN239_07045 [Mycolicibacterium sp. Y3]